ncbi:MAG: tail fiber domain-containing protein [Bacteroidota bacterium]
MKTMTLILLLVVFVLPMYSQNITNTLGTGGVFTIKDASNSYLTLSQSSGLLSLSKNLNLLTTTSSSLGVITKGGSRFIHDFAPAGANGLNIFIGMNSGNFTMTGTSNSASYNTGIGYNSLQSLTTGSYNTALGCQSLSSNTTGVDNIAVGGGTLYANTGGYQNTAVGAFSLGSNTTGNLNTAMGEASLQNNTTGGNNTAVGSQSLCFNGTGFSNTAVGYESLFSNTTGYYNTAVGDSSLFSNATGNSNTAMGYRSLASNTTGYYNTAVGYRSLRINTSGGGNTVVGYNAGAEITGSNNTVIGYNNGLWAGPPPDLTGSNNTVIGSGAYPSAATVSNEITLGSSDVTTLRCHVMSITALSDARDKKNIHDLSIGIDFLMKLKPRLFNWDKREWYKDNKSDGSKMQKTPAAGFIAQELDEVQTKENAEWLNLVLKNNPEKLEATPGNLLPVMVKALQELKTENSELKDKLDKFERMQKVLVSEIEQLKSKDIEFKQVRNGN